MRACERCGGSLEGRRSHARYCSPPCRSAARHHRADETVQKRAGGASWPSLLGLRNFAEDLEAARAAARQPGPVGAHDTT